MKGAYYNEIDPYAAQWLRNLIAAGHIAPGDVDERSIVDVRPDDLRGYRQCHFFAGIGVWSYALRQAGWPDDREVWTGSCPCQAFSAAGRKGGFDDSRHLWPYWSGLIGECRPAGIFGEQVASSDGLAWLDFVCADLEGAGYAVGALDLCAAGFGAPHVRQRLFFVADSERGARQQHGLQLAGTAGTAEGAEPERQRLRAEPRDGGELGGLADAEPAKRRAQSVGRADGAGADDGLLGNAGSEGREWREQFPARHGNGLWPEAHGSAGESGSPLAGFWRDADWLPCIDGKARPVEPGTFPLAHGAPARVGRLRAYGNAIVAPVAAEFIRAYIECQR